MQQAPRRRVVIFAVIGAAVLAAAVVFLGWRPNTRAASTHYIHTCSNATIAGQYGFQDEGTRIVDGKEVPYAAVRTAIFSGEGKHEGKGYASIGGKVRTSTVVGTFKVHGNCTFTMDAVQTYDDGTSNAYKQFGIVVRGGKEIAVLQTSADKVQSGRYQKMTDY
jgi:hypothetical protein